jgi:hypothetical protein
MASEWKNGMLEYWGEAPKFFLKTSAKNMERIEPSPRFSDEIKSLHTKI